MSKSPADFFASSLHGTPGAKAATPAGEGGLFVPRDDPRRLLIREELPLSSSAKSRSTGRTPKAGAGLAPQLGRTNGTPKPLNGFHAEGLNGIPSSASPLTLKSLSPPNSAKDTLDILPKLEREGYSMEPSMNQLKVMAMDDRDSLAFVANFTVRKDGIGSVRWLDTVDLTGLDIDSIVTLAQGAIDVYPDSSVKPPVGHGLNRPAVITLMNVYKKDKATGKPTKDPEVVEKHTRKLKSICADQGAKFISYNGETGEWKFEVEHFSRYGLDGSSEDEDDEDNGEGVDRDNIAQAKYGNKPASPVAPRAQDVPNSSYSDFSDISEDSEDAQLGIMGRYKRQEVTVGAEVPAPVDVLGSPRYVPVRSNSSLFMSV